MSILAIVVLVVVVLAVLAYLFVGRRGPLNSVERVTDQRQRVSAFGKPRRFQEDLERPREEGGRPRGI